jgi:hypothetical protein
MLNSVSAPRKMAIRSNSHSFRMGALRFQSGKLARAFVSPAIFPVFALAVFLMVQEAHATPQYARSTSLSCVDCHSVPPKLNARGESFLARGYRLAAERDLVSTLPFSVWITTRFEDRSPQDLAKIYVPKVELISGGPIGDQFSYFLEWRVVSLDLRNDGTLRDRGGRFEDAFLNWEINERNTLTAGQFRSLTQYDVSLRLSVSEPALFSTALAGDPAANRRIESLRAFSPSGRSPGVAYTLQSVQGQSASDGLFHIATIPFPGEFSIPLSSEARREASFELEGSPKGLFLETFYRHRLNSIGAHAFLDDGRWLVTGVGRVNYKDFYATAGVGLDDARGRGSRTRYSLEAEYLPGWHEAIRPGAGFRVEHVTNAGREPAYIPYFVLSGPNSKYTFLLQVEARFQGNNRGLFLDLSALF